MTIRKQGLIATKMFCGKLNGRAQIHAQVRAKSACVTVAWWKNVRRREPAQEDSKHHSKKTRRNVDRDAMSIESLKEYIDELRDEIARVEDEITKKEKLHTDAAKFFKE